MNAKLFVLGSAVVVAASLAGADPGNGLAKGHEKQRERMAPIELEWKRDKARRAKDEESAPTAPDLPEDIRVVVVKSGQSRVAVPRARPIESVDDRAER